MDTLLAYVAAAWPILVVVVICGIIGIMFVPRKDDHDE